VLCPVQNDTRVDWRPAQVAAEYGFQQVTTTDELDAALPHAAPFSVATISGACRTVASVLSSQSGAALPMRSLTR
jgi:hypothetical protein